MTRVLVREERGQAALLMLALVGALLVGALVLFASGNALGAKGRHQRAADLAAISAAQVMRELYPRLFEPPFIESDLRNPRYLEEAAYRALAVAAAVRGAHRNGVRLRANDVSFGGTGFAPTRVTVRVRGDAHVRFGSGRHVEARVPIRARATAELAPDAGAGRLPSHGSGGGYDGPLVYRQGRPKRSDVGLAFDRLAAAARHERGCPSASRAAFAPTPSRRRCSLPTPTRNGLPHRARAFTATPPSSTSARQKRGPGCTRTASASASCRDSPGSRGTRGCH